jgi:hypothetical protein
MRVAMPGCLSPNLCLFLTRLADAGVNPNSVDTDQQVRPSLAQTLLLNVLMCAGGLVLGLLLLVAGALAAVLLTVVVLGGLCNFTLRSLWAAARTGHA